MNHFSYFFKTINKTDKPRATKTSYNGNACGYP